MVCALLYVMFAIVRYVDCCVISGLLLLYWLLCRMWALVFDVGCCMICGLFYGVSAVVRYVDYCMKFGLLYGMWAVV